MIQNEQILEYIDGLLGPDAEQALFDAMARQPELRSALRQFIAIGDAVRADREAYAPPSDVERALMNNLGLGNLLPHAGVPGGTAAASGVLAGLSSFGGRFWGMMLSFLLGVLLAGTSVAYMMTDSADPAVAGRATPGTAGSRDAGPNDPAGNTASPGDAANGPASGAVPQLGGEDARGGADGPGMHERSMAMRGSGEDGTRSGTASGSGNGAGLASQRMRNDRSFSSAATTTDRSGRRLGGGGRALESHDSPADPNRSSLSSVPDDRSAASVSSRADVTPVEPRAARVRDELPSRELLPDAPSRAPQEFLPVTPEADDTGRTSRIALEGRMNLGGAYQPNNALRSPSPTDDLIGAILLRPAGPFEVGLEFGKESFDQTLYSVSAETLQVEQRPSYLWLGATGRLYLGELPFGGIETFVQGTAAYSTGGPVMRLRLGGRMPVAPALDLTFGAETAGLIYTFQNRQFVSGRWGLSGGVQWTLW